MAFELAQQFSDSPSEGLNPSHLHTQRVCHSLYWSSAGILFIHGEFDN